jgi:hypothetical protein
MIPDPSINYRNRIATILTLRNSLVILIISTACTLLTYSCWGQSNLSLTTPILWSSVKVKDNWTPPTAPNYSEHKSGSALGYGIQIRYTFQLKHIIRSKNIFLNIGTGYFKQRFDIKRPFDYNSPLEPIYYTDHYSYHCWQGLLGLSYSHTLRKNYFLSGGLTYSILHSFRQDYTPTYSSGTDFFTQINYKKMNFGKIACLSAGLHKYLGKRFSIGLELLMPVYTRWRNDKIFRDNPSTFYNPTFSLGSYLSISYRLKEKPQI